jgi:hypothetical protein
MSTGSWDKRQWQLLTDVSALKPDGTSELLVATANNLLGVGPHGFIAYAYNGSLISQVTYYTSNPNSGGTLVATVNYAYDSSDNVISIERI